MSAFIPPEQTVCLKSVPHSMLQRVLDAISKQEAKAKLGVRFVSDKDPACAGELLVYANYASAREAVCARDSLEVWARQPGGPLVMLKPDMCNRIYFALYVANTPTGTTPAELEHVFAKYGPLHKSRGVCAIKETEFFINFMTYAGADTAFQAAQRDALRFEGSILTANAARNTKFIHTLIAKMPAERKYSFSMEDAKSVGEEMTDWPPQPSDIEALLKAVPQHFVLDRKDKRFLVIDRNAPIAPAAAPPPSRRPRACSPEATREERAYLSAMNAQVRDSFDLLHQLFLRLWYDVKGAVWTDSDGLWASISAEQLREELGYQQLPPEMLRPVRDWELGHLATALTSSSLKARLNGIIVRSDSCDVDATYARYMMLVDDKLISHGDLLNKYVCTFAAVRTSAVQAVQTVRYLRNILCHRSGSVKGLSAACFTCLRDLSEEALSILDAALLHLKQPVAESICGEDQSNMGALEQAMQHEHAESFCNALEASQDSTCSSNSIELVSEEVEHWGVAQVMSFFEKLKFPTAGVMAGEGMGFNRLLFRGRFKKEMANLRADQKTYQQKF
jgi:hypothetical protein